MKVVCYNIRHGVGCDGRLDLERIAAVIEGEEPDLVGLNEVDVGFHRRSRFEDQAARLAERLGMRGLFGPAIQVGLHPSKTPRQYGNGLLFRGEMTETDNQILPGRGEEPRAILSARIRTEGRSCLVVVTHVGFTPWMRRSQTRALLDLYRRETGPVILMGDWNAAPDHPLVSRVVPPWVDVLAEAGETGASYPCPKPRKRIDYIFCSRQFQVVEARVVETPGCPSDHRPVSALLRLPG